jgi:hypothetical protein
MAKKSTAVAKKEEKGSAVSVPSWMEGYAGAGTEDVGADAIEIPRIKLLQALSPELEEYEDLGLRPGEWWHNVAEQTLGREVKFIPCYVTRSYILFKPRESGGGILARSNDGVHWDNPDAEFEIQLKDGTQVTWSTEKDVPSSGLTMWGSSNPKDPQSQPAATAMINVVCMLPNDLGLSPCVLSFQRSGFKIGKRFVGQLKISRIPSFGRLFNLFSQKVDGPSGPYLEPRTRAIGLVEDQDLFENCRQAYELFKQRGVQVADIEDTESEEGSAESKEY